MITAVSYCCDNKYAVTLGIVPISYTLLVSHLTYDLLFL